MSEKVKKTLRIYRQHDLDLYFLGLCKSFGLGKEIKKALIAEANHLEYTPPKIPEIPDTTIVKTKMLLILNFDPNKQEEAMALELLKKVKYGYGCSFMKALFREKLREVPLSAYYLNSGLELSDAEIIRGIQKKQRAAIVSKEPLKPKETVKEEIFKEESLKEETFEEEAFKEEPFEEESFEESFVEESKMQNVSNEQNEQKNFTSFFSQMDALTHA